MEGNIRNISYTESTDVQDQVTSPVQEDFKRKNSKISAILKNALENETGLTQAEIKLASEVFRSHTTLIQDLMETNTNLKQELINLKYSSGISDIKHDKQRISLKKQEISLEEQNVELKEEVVECRKWVSENELKTKRMQEELAELRCRMQNTPMESEKVVPHVTKKKSTGEQPGDKDLAMSQPKDNPKQETQATLELRKKLNLALSQIDGLKEELKASTEKNEKLTRESEFRNTNKSQRLNQERLVEENANLREELEKERNNFEKAKKDMKREIREHLNEADEEREELKEQLKRKEQECEELKKKIKGKGVEEKDARKVTSEANGPEYIEKIIRCSQESKKSDKICKNGLTEEDIRYIANHINRDFLRQIRSVEDSKKNNEKTKNNTKKCTPYELFKSETDTDFYKNFLRLNVTCGKDNLCIP